MLAIGAFQMLIAFIPWRPALMPTASGAIWSNAAEQSCLVKSQTLCSESHRADASAVMSFRPALIPRISRL